MLRTLNGLARRVESVSRTSSSLLAASARLEEGPAANAAAAHSLELAPELMEHSTGASARWSLHDQPAHASTSAQAVLGLIAPRSGVQQLPCRGLQQTGLVPSSSPAHAVRQGPVPFALHHSQQLRAAASKAKAKTATKGKPGAGGSADKAEAGERVYTPEWAHLPSLLEEVPDVLRKRKGRLARMRRVLEAEAAKLEASGWTPEARRKAAKALEQAKALPVSPEDGGAAELSTATAAATPFEEARGTMVDLMRRGVLLDAEAHLAPLLRKAGDAGALSGCLAVLRTNHLLQAALRAGQHGARHAPLHETLVQECKRLGAAAPLVELWDSLYEHGMEPRADAATAAVRAAVELRDGRAAATLLALSCQYGKQPLVTATEATAVVSLLEAGNTEEAASLRQLLPRLGL